ncbi:MAG: pentapeptide repeat-containing protein [Desulfonatronovibrio sp.]
MIKVTFLFICFFLLTTSAFAQQVIDNCPLQMYTRCPGVNLSNANLEGINLHGAFLKGANLKGANLKNANLIEVYFFEADLTGANLAGADLSRAIWPDGRVCAFGSIGLCN